MNHEKLEYVIVEWFTQLIFNRQKDNWKDDHSDTTKEISTTTRSVKVHASWSTRWLLSHPNR